MTDALEIHIIELPKILRKIENGEIRKADKLTLWAIFLINPNKIGGKEMSDNEEIKEAKELYDKIQSNEREQELAELRLKYIRDNNAIQKYGYEHGYEKGREDENIAGKKELLKERKKIAKKLLNLGLDIKQIQEITQLTINEIEELKNN